MNNLDQIRIKDAPSLSPETQEELRKRTVRSVLDGMTQIKAAKIFGITRQAVGKWIKAYREGGIDALKAKKRGHPISRTLRPEQEQEDIETITRQTPDQLELSYGLWTRKAVAELISLKFEICLSPRTIGRYLKRWGFTPQKPLRRAYEQNPQSVTQWLEQEYPKIQREARAEDAKILWGDEMGLRSDHADRIHLYFLPSYSPELNPTEYLNQDVKSNTIGKKRPRNLIELMENIRRYLRRRQQKPQIVMNYFKEKHVSYATV
jgi:transposase